VKGSAETSICNSVATGLGLVALGGGKEIAQMAAPGKARSRDRIPLMADRDQVSAESEISDQIASFGDDWPAKVTATITQYVGTVRSKTTGPALVASRYVVYGIAMALIACILAVLLLVLAFRVLVIVTGYAPFVGEGEVWLADLILGGVLLLVGLILWRKKG